MKKFVIIAFITSSVILAANFGSKEDEKIKVPGDSNSLPIENHEVEDTLIDNFQFVNLEELKSSSTGLIRMSDTTEENNNISESIDTTESELQLEDSSEIYIY